VERGELEERLDAQFYQPRYLELEHKLRQSPYSVQRLRDLALQIVDGPFGSQLKVEEYVPSGIPLVRVSDVKTGELVDDGLVFITPEKQQQLKRSQVLPGDVILTKAGAILGYSAVFPNRWAEGNITSHSVSIRCKDAVRNRYLSFYLRSEFGNRQIYRWGSKATRPELNTEEVGYILVVVPSLDVQDAIADKLGAAYRCKRELEAEAEALLESVDRYVLDQVGRDWGADPQVAEESSGPAFFTAWRHHVGRLDPKRYRWQSEIENTEGLRHLGELLIPRRDKVYREEYEFEDLQLITLHFDGTVEPRDVPSWRTDIKGTLYFAYPGDLVYSKIDARNGAIGVVPDELGKVAVTSEYPVYQVKEDIISPVYLKLVLRSSRFTALLRALASGHSGRKRIYPDAVEDIYIPVPAIEEQRKIADEVQRRRERAVRLQERTDRVVAEAKAEVERMILGGGGQS
jgi:type I restriction enzyme S subunit